MYKLQPQDWAAVLVLALMFLVMFVARESGLIDQLRSPMIREPIMELPTTDDGGSAIQTSYTEALSRAIEPFRLRPRI